MIDPVQDLASKLNRYTVFRILRNNPRGVTIKQVAENSREVHDQMVSEFREAGLKRISDFKISHAEQPLPVEFLSVYLLDKIPKAGNSRLTARKYLEELCRLHHARKSGRLFFPSEPVVPTELSAALHKLLRPANYQETNFLSAPNVALFQTYVSPTENPFTPSRDAPDADQPEKIQYRFAFDEFFNSQIPKFSQSLFHLDQIMEEAIAHGRMSEDVYDPTRRRLNLGLLRKGWEAYFGEASLLAWVFAINPVRLLEYIETNGQEAATLVFSQKWKSILERASRRRERRLREERARAFRAASLQDASKGERAAA